MLLVGSQSPGRSTRIGQWTVVANYTTEQSPSAAGDAADDGTVADDDFVLLFFEISFDAQYIEQWVEAIEVEVQYLGQVSARRGYRERFKEMEIRCGL